MNIRGLLMKTFGKFAITWEGDKYRIIFPGYMRVEEVQQRAVIPVFYESLANSLGAESKATWWKGEIHLALDQPLEAEAHAQFIRAATNVSKAFLDYRFWLGVLLGAIAEKSLTPEEDEEAEGED